MGMIDRSALRLKEVNAIAKCMLMTSGWVNGFAAGINALLIKVINKAIS